MCIIVKEVVSIRLSVSSQKPIGEYRLYFLRALCIKISLMNTILALTGPLYVHYFTVGLCNRVKPPKFVRHIHLSKKNRDML